MKTGTVLLLFFLFIANVSFGQDSGSDGESVTVVYQFNIKDVIAAPAWHHTLNAFKEAEKIGADIVFIDLDTYGGQVDYADSIRTKILRSQVPVYVLINNNAASAGALISIACDSIYMTPGSTIGAATVVDQSGNVVPDKYQSYMRSKMRATAEETNRDPDIAEAMVDPDKEIEGISEKGKVLTFTVEEAIANNYCQAEVNSVHEALKHSGLKKYKIEKYRPGTIDKIIAFLINPAVSGLLIMVMFAGIYFELQTPGVGFPLVAALAAAVLFFAPYYLEGMAENWEIILFVVGLALIAIEVFVIPGFGITGISGIALVFTGLILSMIGNIGFDFSFIPPIEIITPLLIVTLTSLLFILLLMVFLPKLFRSGALSFAVLKTDQKVAEGYIGVDRSIRALVGMEGIAFTDLRPSGKVLIDGMHYDAFTEEGYIEKGTPVKVTGYENAQIIVLSNKTTDNTH